MSSKKVAAVVEDRTNIVKAKRLAANSGYVPEKKNVEASPLKKKLEKEPSDINKSAEAFIQRFRPELLLQRLESIENYEQMLKRGT